MALSTVAFLGGGSAAVGLGPAGATVDTAAAATPSVTPGATPSVTPLTPGLPSLGGPSTATTSTDVTVATSGGSADSGLSGPGAAAIGVGALAVIAGISFFIWRDARRHAPARGRAGDGRIGGEWSDGRHSTGSKARRPKKLSATEKRRRKRGRAPRRR